ncbi:hypothetical protein [Paracoccus albus]|uniref:hypothetical protein n=1 Tax=Paracoccus albus TaxID=3017784 RepID=UPI0022F011BC|nr:hypothetical protein [Paracoccus albus]WBU59471.1 hypothetical protein PAF20_11930 [Paracoccus albus]
MNASLIMIGIVVIFAIVGFMRAWGGSYVPLLFMIGACLISAALCWITGGNKTGAYLAGIVGILAAVIMLCVAGGLFLGGLFGAVARALREYAPPEHLPEVRIFDAVVVYGLAAVAFILSVMEKWLAEGQKGKRTLSRPFRGPFAAGNERRRCA